MTSPFSPSRRFFATYQGSFIGGVGYWLRQHTHTNVNYTLRYRTNDTVRMVASTATKAKAQPKPATAPNSAVGAKGEKKPRGGRTRNAGRLKATTADGLDAEMHDYFGQCMITTFLHRRVMAQLLV